MPSDETTSGRADNSPNEISREIRRAMLVYGQPPGNRRLTAASQPWWPSEYEQRYGESVAFLIEWAKMCDALAEGDSPYTPGEPGSHDARRAAFGLRRMAQRRAKDGD